MPMIPWTVLRNTMRTFTYSQRFLMIIMVVISLTTI